LINKIPAINNPLNEDKLFSEGVVYINTAQWLPAYTVFRYLFINSGHRSFALLYNMALCHFFAKEYEKTIEVLNQASQELIGTTVIATDPLPGTLTTYECDNNGHYYAITPTIAVLQRSVMKIRIRRLLLDTYVALQNWPEVKRLAAMPGMASCKNVTEALLLANK
jgi:hypothetical protein